MVGDSQGSEHLYVRASATAGRGLFAAADLPQAVNAFSKPKPTVAALDIPFLQSVCSNCYAASRGADNVSGPIEIRPCSSCRVTYYCSRNCQREAWDSHHQYECQLFSLLSRRDRILPNGARLVLQMINLVAKQNNNCFNGLMTHLQDVNRLGGERKETLEAMSYGMYSYLGRRVDLGTVRNFFAIVLTNGITLMTPSFDPLGVCLEPFLSLANHSCDPNAYILFDGPKIALRTLRPISKHEEVTIGYIETTNPYRQRQKELMQQYFFTCPCSKCQRDSNCTSGLSESSATLGNEDEVFDTLDVMKKQSAGSESESALSILETKVERALRLLIDTASCPEYCQPLAGIRHEQFTLLISCGLPHALLHAILVGLKMKFESNPILYPEKHHPLRVVRAWTLVSLIMYIASQENSLARRRLLGAGVDFDAVAFGLLTELLESAELSHGRDSSFYRKIHLTLSALLSRLGPGDHHMARFRQEQIPILQNLSDSREIDHALPVVC